MHLGRASMGKCPCALLMGPHRAEQSRDCWWVMQGMRCLCVAPARLQSPLRGRAGANCEENCDKP